MRRHLLAVNTAPDSENQMHGERARLYGFASGLVPGVDVLAYLAHEAVDRWGADWLGGGRLDGRLERPVYDREAIDVVREDAAADPADPAVLAVRVEGGAGDVRARASLSRVHGEGAAPVAADPARFPVRPRPDPGERPPASRDALAPGTVLATQVAHFRADRAPSYLDEISEDLDAFRVDGLAHPGWLLRFANWALSSTVRLGPWIHVSSDAWFLAPVRDGDELEVRAVVTDCFERKGHELVDLDVLHLVRGAPVAFVAHRAIWQPRTTEDGT